MAEVHLLAYGGGTHQLVQPTHPGGANPLLQPAHSEGIGQFGGIDSRPSNGSHQGSEMLPVVAIIGVLIAYCFFRLVRWVRRLFSRSGSAHNNRPEVPPVADRHPNPKATVSPAKPESSTATPVRAIFLSYRREDTEGQAGRLYADLKQAFGDTSVFIDVAGIDPGLDFRRVIDKHVASCGVLLALIGPEWLDAKDNKAGRRLDSPTDFVRLETAAALRRDIPVVPILVRGAQMPKPEQLPEDLKDLAFRNCVELTHVRWDSDVGSLIKKLEHLTA
jgi:hypothetical protein